MADPIINDIGESGAPSIGGDSGLNLNKRLDCEHLDQMTDNWTDYQRPSFVTVLLRFFGNVFVDIFNAIFG
ncbi:uncharacterized protein LOC6547879 [Drosophila erecta]|uniref:Uncharacterized protein n=1 Tax=Drosophila erecta TaxID=7220 RepID=B3NP92_DROER|nr:uncharacterized protein LOC6547879 [Drosophila erecta]EDV56755.1 uncharacterized protein Dere_GG22830 [Drosophila erecta]